MMQIAALRSRLEKQPTDLRRSPRDLGDGALASPLFGVHNRRLYGLYLSRDFVAEKFGCTSYFFYRIPIAATRL
jgi:hypothetical protein